MNNLQKYTSLELSKKIDDLAKKKGIELPESEMSWVYTDEEKWELVASSRGYQKYSNRYIKIPDYGFSTDGSYGWREIVKELPAYDTFELGEMLPKHTGGYFLKIQMDNKFYFSTHISEDDDENLHQEEEETIAEVMGKMYFYLLDNNLL